MVTPIIEMLQAEDHMGATEEIEIAKGKYELTLNPTKLATKVRRGRALKKARKDLLKPKN